MPPEVLTAGEVVFDGTLAFMGYQAPKAARQGTAVDVMTYWRVLARPSRPLSLMLHLFGADDTPIAVGDGLGVPFDQLFPGDVIVQRHSLVIPANAKADTYQVRSGAYWLDNIMRLTADGGDSIILTLIQIKQN